jgi:hypothetical protein
MSAGSINKYVGPLADPDPEIGGPLLAPLGASSHAPRLTSCPRFQTLAVHNGTGRCWDGSASGPIQCPHQSGARLSLRTGRAGKATASRRSSLCHRWCHSLCFPGKSLLLHPCPACNPTTDLPKLAIVSVIKQQRRMLLFNNRLI